MKQLVTHLSARQRRRAILFAGTILISGYSTPALGQAAGIAPIRIAPDENGVDVATGEINAPLSTVTIGDPASGGMVFSEGWANGQPQDNVSVVAFIDTTGATGGVILEGGTERNFFGPTFPLVSETGNGETISNNGDGTFNHNQKDGTIRVIGFADPSDTIMYVKKIISPNGEEQTYHYKTQASTSASVSRIQSITNNTGYQMKFTYVANAATPSDIDYLTPASVTLINNAVDYCDPLADACNGLTQSWPKLTFSKAGNTKSYTDALGRVTQISWDTNLQLASIVRPSGSGGDMTITHDANGRVATVANAGIVSNYSWNAPVGSSEITGTRSGALGTSRVTVANPFQGYLKSDTDALGRTTFYTNDGYGRLTGVTFPEGNMIQQTLDSRGNVTQLTRIAKPGSGLANIVVNADYDLVCTNLVKCDQPNWTRDQAGNQTDYAYDVTSGRLNSVTSPAAIAGGIRPQTRYSYTGMQAFYKNSSGAVVASGTTIQRLTGISTCQTAASCAGMTDEVKTTIAFGPQAAGTVNNLLVTGTTTGSGNGALTATSSFTYDAVGNRLTVDGPLPGVADTSRMRFDAVRQVVGVVSPDPDGAGALPNRAQRITYNPGGQVILAESGTVANQSDTAWAAFSSQQQAATTYDSNGRPVKQELKAGGTTYALNQTSYDALGRVDCTAQRMDPAQWGGQTVVCTPQLTGPNGPDRISRTIYNAVNQVVQVQSALGTTDQATDITTTFNINGTTATMKDGENNLTTYEYDGFDRLSKTRYPALQQGASSSSATDYEQLTYNAAGNVTQRRLRNGQAISYAYDNLNRVVLKIRPDNTGWQTNHTYSYDLLGRITGAAHIGHSLSYAFTYDALGRKTTETNSWFGAGHLAFQYDASGRRTRTTWGDGTYVSYDYLVTGEMKTIRENGAASGVGVLATFAYDNLGRRTELTRGNGTVTSYAFDPVSRLTSLTQNLAGTANDITIGLGYTPASQINAQTRSNDSYAWNGHYNVNSTNSLNGLNQLTTAGATNLSFDAKGNLAGAGTKSYGYSSENELVSSSTGGIYNYDPLGRLFNENIPSGNTTFQYDGGHITTETGAGSALMLRRYVYGPGTDEPLVWYEGSGLTDRRWLHADERGSIIAITNGSGALLNKLSYDEYGIPATSNTGRFGYTGQAWLPDLAMPYYKARIYFPMLGRFMQTDPIGYGAGMNLYNYVGSDPVNAVDPSGMIEAPAVPIDVIYRSPNYSGLPFDFPTWSPEAELAGRLYFDSLVNESLRNGWSNVTPPRRGTPGRSNRTVRACQSRVAMSLARTLALEGATMFPLGGDVVNVLFTASSSTQATAALLDNDLHEGAVVVAGFTVSLASYRAAQNGGRALTRRLPWIGYAITAYSLGKDGYDAYQEYRNCER